MNRVTTVTTPANNTAVYAWKANSLISSVAYPNGMNRSYGYDSANRLTSW